MLILRVYVELLGRVGWCGDRVGHEPSVLVLNATILHIDLVFRKLNNEKADIFMACQSL